MYTLNANLNKHAKDVFCAHKRWKNSRYTRIRINFTKYS